MASRDVTVYLDVENENGRSRVRLSTPDGDALSGILPAEARQATAQALAGDLYEVVPVPAVNAASILDPADVKVGDVVEVEASDGSWLVRGEVAAVNRDYAPRGLLIHAATEDPCMVHTSRATVRLVRRAEPELDAEQVQALWQLGFDLGAARGEPLLSHDEARDLVRRGVRVQPEDR